MNDQKHGYGIINYADGAYYKGNWRNDSKDGRGYAKLYSGAGEGEFKDGKKHGKGKYTWKNGDVYEGEWVNDQKHGNNNECVIS